MIKYASYPDPDPVHVQWVVSGCKDLVQLSSLEEKNMNLAPIHSYVFFKASFKIDVTIMGGGNGCFLFNSDGRISNFLSSSFVKK